MNCKNNFKFSSAKVLILSMTSIFLFNAHAHAEPIPTKKAKVTKKRERKMNYGFSMKFDNVKVGDSTDSVLRLLGAATRADGSVWRYFENRVPRPGEQLTVFEIHFKDGKVISTFKIPGPTASGSAR